MANRKQDILEALAKELQERPGGRITTAALAEAVGVSEAALYRHFPSKARMFEGLIAFAEESIFSRINQILDEEKQTAARCAKISYLLLGFAERNPGITRVLLGDALVGEKARLHERIQLFFDKLQTQFRQVLRESQLRGDAELPVSPESAAQLLVAYIEGKMQHYLRSRFTVSTLADWEADWRVLARGLFDR